MANSKKHEVFKVVMITFESYHVKKVGGLAEVPPRLARALLEEGVNVEVYTPAHGAVDACNEAVYVIDGFCASILKGVKPTHYVIGGRTLDDPTVYPSDRLIDKSIDFAKAIGELYEKHPEVRETTIIFHGHDWHSLPALIKLNSISTKLGRRDKFIYHVHLLSRARLPFDKICRELNVCEDTPIRGVDGVQRFDYYYRQSGELAERLAALVVDAVVTVSRGYARSVERIMGPRSWSRVGVVPNASPLSWTEVRQVLKDNAGVNEPEELNSRLLFRRSLLTEKLRGIYLTWTTSRIEQIVRRVVDSYGVEYNKPFKSDGPMLFAIGRLSKQKGFDILFKAMDRLIMHNPRIRAIVTALPIDENPEQIRELVEIAITYEENLRVLPGALGRDFTIMLYYAANATIVPSRSEPFGLVALESMASGTPVAASRVDGLVDVVNDIQIAGLHGTGVHFEPLNPVDLAEKTSFLTELIESGYRGEEEGIAIRRSCIERASQFNWRASALQAINVYNRETMAPSWWSP